MEMDKFSISDLEAYTDIKAATLRIWEKRYNLIEPKRTDTNIRYYTADDLQLLLAVSALQQRGIKISKIVDLGKKGIFEMLRTFDGSEGDFINERNQLRLGMLSFQKELMHESIKAVEKNYGVERVMEALLFPFIIDIGNWWMTNAISPYHEHFASVILRNYLAAKIHELEQHAQEGPKVLIMLPEDELHELSLLYFHLRLMQMGYQVVNLGQSTPIEGLTDLYETIRPEFIFVHLFAGPHQQKAMDALLEQPMLWPRLVLAGDNIRPELLKSPVKCFEHPKDAITFLSNYVSV